MYQVKSSSTHKQVRLGQVQFTCSSITTITFALLLLLFSLPTSLFRTVQVITILFSKTTRISVRWPLHLVVSTSNRCQKLQPTRNKCFKTRNSILSLKNSIFLMEEPTLRSPLTLSYRLQTGIQMLVILVIYEILVFCNRIYFLRNL